MKFKISCETWLAIFGTLLSVLLRACTTLHSYSGEATPPMYGDYEAQRHWMEITTNLPIRQWYMNSSVNNLEYWGLDYPPLTAYHMYINGRIANLINKNYTKLQDSRGYESEPHKFFMRCTVLFSDIVLYIPALILYYQFAVNINNVQDTGVKKKKIKTVKRFDEIKPMDSSLTTILALLYPGIILIDHGHFQYNNISLGFAILATTSLLLEYNILCTILFCLSLNYKQMELYHALPFFFYLLSTCVPKPGQSAFCGIYKLVKIGITVIITFVIIWLPFLYNIDIFMQVLHRQFPIARGIFEDKVANIWCALNIYFKFKTRLDNYEMFRICLFTTLSALFPSCVDLFLRPNLRKFVLSLINSSLAFFLFSFQVHEKSILLVAIPVLMYFPYAPFECFWFSYISVFSMLPLLIKDKLLIAVIALVVFYLISFRVSIEHTYRSSLNNHDGLIEYYRSLFHTLLDIEYKKTSKGDMIKRTLQQIVKNSNALKTLLVHSLMSLSISGSLILFIFMLIFEPPKRYPDLYPLLISVYSCVHFLGFFIFFNIKQLRIPQQFEDIRNVKVKST